MPADMTRWLLVFVVILSLLGLLLFARGVEHQRGDDVGAFGIAQTLAGP